MINGMEVPLTLARWLHGSEKHFQVKSFTFECTSSCQEQCKAAELVLLAYLPCI